MPDLFRLKLVSKRQVTIPQRVLDLLGLKLGDEIHLKIGNGKIMQAYPVKIGPDQEMSDDAKQRFEEIEKETASNGVPDTDLTALMDEYAGAPQAAESRAEPNFNKFLKDLFSSQMFPGFSNPVLGAWGTFCRVPPRNFQRTDERIAEIVAEFLANAQIDISGVEIRVENGVVALSGTINDKSSRLVAELAARSVLGVKDVQNDIVSVDLGVLKSIPRVEDLRVK